MFENDPNAKKNLEMHTQLNAIDSPAKLKAFLKSAGMDFVILKTDDLVDALLWPEGVEQFKLMIAQYGNFRSTQGTGYAIDLDGMQVELTKDANLHFDEIEEARAQLARYEENQRARLMAKGVQPLKG